MVAVRIIQLAYSSCLPSGAQLDVLSRMALVGRVITANRCDWLQGSGMSGCLRHQEEAP